MAEPALRAAQASVISGGDIGRAMAGLLAARAREAQLTAAAQQRARQQEATRAAQMLEFLTGEARSGLEQGIAPPVAITQMLKAFGPVGAAIVKQMEEETQTPQFVQRARGREITSQLQDQITALREKAALEQQQEGAEQEFPAQLVRDLGARVQAGQRARTAEQRVQELSQERRLTEQVLAQVPTTFALEFGAPNLNAAVAAQRFELEKKAFRTPEELAQIEVLKQQQKDTFKSDLNRQEAQLSHRLKLKAQEQNQILKTQAAFVEDGQRAELQPFAGSIPFRVGNRTIYVEPTKGDEFKAVSDIGKLVQDRDALVSQFGPDDSRVAALNIGLANKLRATQPDLGDIREAKALTIFDKPFFNLNQDQRAQVEQAAQDDEKEIAEAGRAEAPLPAELVTRIGSSNTAIRIANDIFKLYSPAFTGPLAGRAGSLKQLFDLTTSQENQLRQSLEALNEMVIRSRTGAQASQAELQRLRAQNPQVTQAPGVLLDYLKSSVRQIMFNRSSIIEGIRATRGDVSPVQRVQPGFDVGVPGAVQVDPEAFDQRVRQLMSGEGLSQQDAQQRAYNEMRGGQ